LHRSSVRRSSLYDARACFGWTPYPDTIPSADTVIAPTCQETAARRIRTAIDASLARCIDRKLHDVDRLYRQRCSAPESIDDTLVVKYPLHYYHFTLYYYDRAGNLVRTIPPKGVHLTSTDRSTNPSHAQATKTSFDSFGLPVKYTTPDGGTTLFFYDSLDRLRFSQDARQQQVGEYSYIKYDDVGRIVEVGGSTQSGSGLAFMTYVDDMSFPQFGTQRTYTVYTQPSGIMYPPSSDPSTWKRQRNLRNRVSFVYTDDGARTHYSYDEHGAIEWIAQEAPGFPKPNYIRYEYELISGNVTALHYNEGRSDQFHHRYTYDADNRLVRVETSFDGVIWDRDVSYSYEPHGPLARREFGEDQLQGLDYTYTITGQLKGINHPSLDSANDPGHDGTSNVYAADSFAMGLHYYGGDFRHSGSPFDSSAKTEMYREGDFVPLYDGNIAGWSQQTGKYESGNQYQELTGETYRYDELGRLDSSRFRDWDPTPVTGEK